MSVTDFIHKIEEAIEELPPGLLKPETEYRQMDVWSSMHALIIIALIDTEYDVSVSGEDLRSCSTLNELYSLIQSRKP